MFDGFLKKYLNQIFDIKNYNIFLLNKIKLVLLLNFAESIYIHIVYILNFKLIIGNEKCMYYLP